MKLAAISARLLSLRTRLRSTQSLAGRRGRNPVGRSCGFVSSTRIVVARPPIRISLCATALLLAHDTSGAEPEGGNWKPGVHYSILARPAVITSAPAGKVELCELFMYTSPISADAQPRLEKWLSAHGDRVVYVRRPSIVFRHARLQAQMYDTLRVLGREDLHWQMFAWAQDATHVRIYHGEKAGHPDERAIDKLNSEFARRNGIDSSKFTAVYRSDAIDREVVQQDIETHLYDVFGTSTFVVDGKYSTSLQRIHPESSKPTEHDWGELFSLLDFLVDQEKRNP
jgi:protein dithiol oxidoreductase (disulfide-forming)